MTHMTWRCGCGKVEVDIPAKGNRVVCYCESCRAFAEGLGAGDRLDAAGGSDLIQLAPENVRFRKGAEHLRWMRLSERGPLRWYAACCNTPMANTLATRSIPFASFQAHDLEPKDSLPPVRVRVNLKGATARVEGATGSALPLILGIVAHAAASRLTGGWKKNPFFDAEGHPVAARQDLVSGH